MSDKTEKPTAKKLRDAHKRGEIARSQDLNTAIVFVAVLGVLWFSAKPFVEVLQSLTELAIAAPAHVRSGVSWILVFQQALTDGARVVLTVLGAASAMAVLVGFWQSKGVFSIDPLMPNLNKLNPAEGLKNMVSSKQLIEVVKLIVKATALSVVLALVLRDAMSPAIRTMQTPLSSVANVGATAWSLLLQMCFYASAVYAVLGVLDVGLQVFQFLQKQRMTKEEIKRERRDQDGDPMIKSQRRRLQREIAQGTGGVPLAKANVLVTNPTHYAVALYYQPGITDLPMVIAKGTDESALALRGQAREQRVPVVENRELARLLHAEVAIDDCIEEAHFEAVAEVLRFVSELSAAPT
jgi:type III secretion protein U